jgi:pimeloyl-ACP methyl ester carboxylesterase
MTLRIHNTLSWATEIFTPIEPGRARLYVCGITIYDYCHMGHARFMIAFDVAQRDYSWMAYLAEAGFDTFAMDTTGYGRSNRPAAMNDPCNLATDRQGAFVPSLIPAPCPASYPHALTTIASDWNDIDGVVNYIRALRHVDKVSLLAWSLGGPRAGGYTAQHPEKVQKLVLLAPAYGRNAPAAPPSRPATVSSIALPIAARRW